MKLPDGTEMDVFGDTDPKLMLETKKVFEGQAKRK